MSITRQENVHSDKRMSSEEAAYVAAMVDGEGTIGIWANSNGRRRSHTFLSHVEITNTNLPLLQSIVVTAGNGRISGHRMNHRSKTCFKWQLSASQIRHVLPQILPHLRLKRRQGDLVSEFLALQDEGRRGGARGVRESDLPRVLAIYEEIRSLNQRGAPSGVERVPLLEFHLHAPRDRKRTCDELGCEDKRYRGHAFCYRHWLQRRARVERICKHCGAVMDAIMPHKQYCSEKCQAAAYHQNVRKPAEQAERRREAVCPVCGETFETDYAARKYCSQRCNIKAYRQRLKEKE